MQKLILSVLFGMVLIFWGCSSDSKKSEEQTQDQSEQAESELTEFQLKNGIGPITEPIKTGPIDTQMAARGKELFDSNCSSCHKIGERYVGPDLQDVTSRRTPTYIMNMILNPTGMTQEHPTAHKLLEQFATQMANLSLERDKARAIVEYLRSVNPNLQTSKAQPNN